MKKRSEEIALSLVDNCFGTVAFKKMRKIGLKLEEYVGLREHFFFSFFFLFTFYNLEPLIKFIC